MVETSYSFFILEYINGWYCVIHGCCILTGVGEYDAYADGNGCARYHQKTSGSDYHLIEGSRYQVKSIACVLVT